MALDVLKAQHLIFDLDDTLFDTFGLLVKPAVLESCTAMIESGLDAQLEICEKKYFEEFVQNPRQNIYEKLVQVFGIKENSNPELVVLAGAQAFYGREIKETIKTFEGVDNTLETLNHLFKLSLVTFGIPKTQKRKIELLNIAKYFSEIVYVDMTSEKSKRAAFEKIMAKYADLEGPNFVSIGNRIDGEIRNGKELQMQTVLMLHGEYLHLEPQNKFEIPDEKIKKITDLLTLFKGRLQ